MEYAAIDDVPGLKAEYERTVIIMMADESDDETEDAA